MQTFLPYADFVKSVRALDNRRLGKQRVECKQILMALLGHSKGWTNHPATRMWRGYEETLKLYAWHVCYEWRTRGYKDSLLPTFRTEVPVIQLPEWFGDDTFHASHRSNLLRKDPIYYGKFGWQEPNDLPYVWPV